MNINAKVSRGKQQRLKKYVAQCDSFDFFNLLTSDELLSLVEDLLPDHRERLFPPTETLSMFLAQALSEDRSCQKAVNESAIRRLTGNLPKCSVSTGGYCKARKRLPLEMVSTLTRHIGSVIDKQSHETWNWHGRSVRLIDGTTVSAPDTKINQQCYPQSGRQEPGLGFPLIRLVGIVCLSSGALLNMAHSPMKGKGNDEQTLIRSMIDTFEANDVVVGDAYYGTYFFLAALQAKGVDATFEQYGARKRTTDFRKGIRLGSKDHLIVLEKPKTKPYWMKQEEYDEMPATITIREFKAKHKIYITTFVDAKAWPKQEITKLYKDRWHIELDFRNIKSTLGMSELSCKSPEMCVKEIWVYMLAYNLIRLLMVQSAALIDVLPRQLSFKHTVQIWTSWIKQSDVAVDLAELFYLIGQVRVGNRLGRVEPRAVKRRDSGYPLLKRQRAEAKAQIMKNGHPKRIKF